MSRTDPAPRVLVVGDPYFDTDAFRHGFADLEGRADISYLQLDTTKARAPRDDAEARLREYAGDPDVVAAALGGHDVLVVHGAPVSEQVLSTPGLRLVCCARGGPVNVDVAAATARGVPVCATPGKNAAAVAELTIAFAFMLLRGIGASSRHLERTGLPPASVFDGREFFGREAQGATIGLVGYGNVGRQVARRASALGMRAVAYDPYVGPDASLEAELTSFDDLLAQSDLVSLHARYTEGAFHLRGDAAIGRMREGAFFINTARERLVDETALVSALQSGHVAGAALDVIEMTGKRSPLLDLPQVVVTPHIGGATGETLRRGAQMAAEAVLALASGLPLPYCVNPETDPVAPPSTMR